MVMHVKSRWLLAALPDVAAAYRLQVKDLNLEEGGAFTISSADAILKAL